MNQNGPIKSQLDRIYVSKDKAKYTFDWGISPTSVPMDHWLVTAKYTPKDAPYIGKGRWTWPLMALNDKKLIKEIVKEGINLQTKIENLKTNPESRSAS